MDRTEPALASASSSPSADSVIQPTESIISGKSDNTSNAFVPHQPYRWHYNVRLIVGVTLCTLYLIGLLTTLPGLMAFLGRWSGSAKEYDEIITRMNEAHHPTQHDITATNSSASSSPSTHLLITSSPLTSWTTCYHFVAQLLPFLSYQPRLPEPARYYSLPNWIDEAAPFFVIAIIVEFIIAHGKEKRRREKKLAEISTRAQSDGSSAENAISSPAMSNGNGHASTKSSTSTPPKRDPTPSDLAADVDDRPIFRWNDSINSMSLGMLQQMMHVSLFVRPLMYVPYIYVWENYAVMRLPVTWWSWILTFLLIDFAYYWTHRFGHEINIFWAGHQPHHSSEEYNFTTALRQGAIQYSCAWIFYLPAAFFIPPPLFSFHNHFNRLYQFWIHTKVIRKLHPIIEYIFNTPSHHRAHHGSNPTYIDCNYGGSLILFDRLFGTFIPEYEPIVYGVTHNINSWNPIWANLHHLNFMYTSAQRATSWRNRFHIVWQGPGWNAKDGSLYPVPVANFQRKRYDRQAIRGWINVTYAVGTFLTNLVALRLLVVVTGLSFTSSTYSLLSWLLSIYVILTVTVVGSWMEGKWTTERMFLIDLARLCVAAYGIREYFLIKHEWSGQVSAILLVVLLIHLILSLRLCSSSSKFAIDNYPKTKAQPQAKPAAKEA